MTTGGGSLVFEPYEAGLRRNAPQGAAWGLEGRLYPAGDGDGAGSRRSQSNAADGVVACRMGDLATL